MRFDDGFSLPIINHVTKGGDVNASLQFLNQEPTAILPAVEDQQVAHHPHTH